jgi:hypothetical protein
MPVAPGAASRPAEQAQCGVPPDDLVLFTLLGLARAGSSRVPEHAVHKAVKRLSDAADVKFFRFITQPIVFSYGLWDSLRALEYRRLLDELVFVHDSWAPQHLYELTPVGIIEAEDRLESAITKKAVSDRLLEVLANASLLSSKEEGDQPTDNQQY